MPSTIEIATKYLSANGCSSSDQSYQVGVPNIEKLDHSYQGVLPGIEAKVNAVNNIGNYYNFAFLPNGAGIEFSLHAHGAGNWVAPPFTGGWCEGAEGGSISVSILAHYV
jgi:hypothetical protein